jgi:hypothetical protein
MSHTLNSIEPFLAFLDMHPTHEFDTRRGTDCAYAMYLIGTGMTKPSVSDDRFRCLDAMGNGVSMDLPKELGQEHCRPDDGRQIISYAMLANRIRDRMHSISIRRAVYEPSEITVMMAKVVSVKATMKELYTCTV